MAGDTVEARARLTDAITGEPLPGKPIGLQSLSATTDGNGTAVFDLLFR
jgi:hypothetical protein